MVLVYDLIAAQPEGSSPVSGGGEYAVRMFHALIDYLSDAPEKGLSLYAVYDTQKPLDEGLKVFAEENCSRVQGLGSIGELPGALEELKADRFFSALPMRFRKLKFPETCEFVYTIHGLRPLELPWDRMEPHYFYSIRSVMRHVIPRLMGKRYIRSRKKHFRQLFAAAKKQQIITVSSHSRYALMAMFPQTKHIPVHTCYSPPMEARGGEEAKSRAEASAQKTADSGILEKLKLEPRSFYLMISANRWGKNSYRMIRVFKELMKNGLVERKVVVAGKGKARFLKSLEAHGQFAVCDYLSRQDLEELYRQAYAFVFPTLNEGFGYPPLECMKFGTPVVASAINSLPELLQDAYLPVDPKSEIELASRILRIEQDGELWKGLSEKAMEQQKVVYQRQVSHRNKLIELLTAEVS